MTLVFLGLFILLLVLIVKAALGQPGRILRLFIHMLGGIVGLWMLNLLLSVFDIIVPINPFTVLLVTLLGFPGAIVLTVFEITGL